MDALQAAAENLMAIDHSLNLANRALELKTPRPDTGAGYIRAKKHLALMRSADAVKNALTPEFEQAKKNLIAAIDVDERRRGV
jgi:hypothetical protein